MRRAELGPRAFQAPVDVHASADGQVYMFRRRPNESTVSSDDDDITVLEMRPRIGQELELLEREVLDGDNLNKLALQYGCKVADIKRANNLLQDQDLFGLKSIRIPVQKHSLLAETELRDPPGPEAPGGGATTPPHLQEVTEFLMEVDHDIEKLIQNTNDDDDDDFLDPEKQQRVGLTGRRPGSHGADWGIQWWNAVVAMLLIGIVLPLFYVIYFKTKDNAAVPPTAGSDAVQPSNASGTKPGR